MDSFFSLANLGDSLSSLPGHSSLPATIPMYRVKQQATLAAITAKYAPDDMQQLDEIADVMHYFCGEGPAVGIIQAYLAAPEDSDPARPTASSSSLLQDTITRLAEPIEHAYTTANNGRLFLSEEKVARGQRKYWSPEEALKLWGPEMDLDELAARVGMAPAKGRDESGGDDNDDDAPGDGEQGQDGPGVEGQLWDLYYTFLHEAKKSPWHTDTDARQHKLVRLLAALQARPDPPRPSPMTIPLSRHWIYEEDGDLWSDLVMLGPSARETWNDAPGCGAGWLPAEVAAWQNVNAFLARLTVLGIADYTLYGTWAMYAALGRDGDKDGDWAKVMSLEGHHHAPPSVEVLAEALFGTVEVWVRLAGRKMLSQARLNEKKKGDGEEKKDEGEVVHVTVERWNRWRRRLEMVEGAQFGEKVVKIAEECVALMLQYEQELEGEEDA